LNSQITDITRVKKFFDPKQTSPGSGPDVLSCWIWLFYCKVAHCLIV